jgi:4-hydroxy-tetrahydrodipicolinate reductase
MSSDINTRKDISSQNDQGARAIRVVVAGPDGRMGQVMVEGLPKHDGIEIVGQLRRADREQRSELLREADVMVEFTGPESAPELLFEALKARTRPVSGSSGIAESVLVEADRMAREYEIGGIWAPNFSMSSNVMMHAVAMIAKYFSTVEIIEAHHETKADAPSGTAVRLAEIARAAHEADLKEANVRHEILPGTRGGSLGGVHVHSLRLPGDVGWHDVVLAAPDGFVTIRHEDSGSREIYVPAVANAVRKVMQPDVIGLLRGYGSIIGLTS